MAANAARLVIAGQEEGSETVDVGRFLSEELQYAPESAHAWLSVTHWGLGLALTIALLWHWIVRLRH